MQPNAKVAFLLLGLLAGAVAGYLTRPEAAELKIGGASIEISNENVAAHRTSGSAGSLTTGQVQHILIYAVGGGIIALLAGFALGRR